VHNFETQPCGTRSLRWQNKIIIKRLGINLRSKVECPVAECTPPKKFRSKNVFIFYDNFCNSDLDTFAKVRFKWFGLMLQNLGGFPCERSSIRVFCFTKISVPRALHEGNENLEPYDPCFLEWSWHIAERQVPLQLWDLIGLNKLAYISGFYSNTCFFFPGTWRALSLLSLRCCSWRVLMMIRVCRVKKTGAVGDRCHFAILRSLLLHLIGSSLVPPIRC